MSAKAANFLGKDGVRIVRRDGKSGMESQKVFLYDLTDVI
jgi:hypothetical protein